MNSFSIPCIPSARVPGFEKRKLLTFAAPKVSKSALLQQVGPGPHSGLWPVSRPRAVIVCWWRRPSPFILLARRRSPFGPAYGCSRLQAALVFACPKKTKQKKGHPHDLPFGFPARLVQNRRCGTRGLRPLRQSSLLPVLACGARLRQGGPGAPWLTVSLVQISLVAGYEVFATSGSRATQQPAGISECRSAATHERGRVRVAQGSPGVAGTGLLEQMLLVTFGETKVTKTSASKAHIRYQNEIAAGAATCLRVTTRIENQYVRRSPSGISGRSRGEAGCCVAGHAALAGPGIPGIGRTSLRLRRPGWR
jgi:hypothetical protein